MKNEHLNRWGNIIFYSDEKENNVNFAILLFPDPQSGKDAIIFTATAEGNNIYKLTPSVKLQAGEYMFIPKSAATSLTGSDVYAFGID